MSYYEGLPFYLLLILILGIALILGALEKPLGRYGLFASLLMIICVFAGDRSGTAWLLLFYVWSIALIGIYFRIRKAKGRNANVYHAVLALSILPLAACKISGAFHFGLFAFTGISYLSFRVIQMIIEIYDGVIKEISFLEITAFLAFFPSFSSGPIDRSRRFHTDWTRTLSREAYLDLAGKGIFELLLGAVYKMVIAAWAYKGMGYLETGTAFYHYIGYAYAYGVYLFFDFAGYSLMAIGSAKVLGIELPPNFRMPFLSLDIRDFWDRWHISLSHWFRDFIFTRFIMYSSKKKWFKDRLTRACVGFFVNMGIMGIWHGITPAYILYGLYHGALLSLTEYYQKKSKFYKENKTIYKIASWAVTMQLVMFGFLLFSGKLIG